ncbi:hypothetical protein ABQF33_14895 [Mycolicibacterium sp. XJ2]
MEPSSGKRHVWSLPHSRWFSKPGINMVSIGATLSSLTKTDFPDES